MKKDKADGDTFCVSALADGLRDIRRKRKRAKCGGIRERGSGTGDGRGANSEAAWSIWLPLTTNYGYKLSAVRDWLFAQNDKHLEFK